MSRLNCVKNTDKSNWRRRAISLAFAALVAAPASQATIVCLMPHPACAVVTGLGIIATFFAGQRQSELQKFSATEDTAAIKSIITQIRNRNQNWMMVKMGSENPGYKEIIRKFENNKISGRNSLESLMDWSPKHFQHLDALEEIISSEVSSADMTATYGERFLPDGSINWARYAKLAADGQALYENLFLFKD